MTATTVPPAIEPAELIWRDGVPESRRFGDIYFSRENGLEESRYVFIGHNNLPMRFAEIPEAGNFVIAESGFGTGLNFLSTWQAWQTHSPSHAATLHYIAAERFPLTRQDLEKSLSLWPELRELSKELIANYPPLISGTHRLVLDGGRVRLTLFFGDIKDALDALSFQADAWYLDGFAPARNPEMWQETILHRLTQHSSEGTTIATFTAAGQIRRALISAGFNMQKSRGFGRKRSMLSGVYEPEIPPLNTPGTPESPATSVAVIGAGIAGCLLAHNLAQRGYSVTLIDSADECGSAASGNLQGAMYVKLGVEFNHQTELALSALTFSQRLYNTQAANLWHPTGLLQLAWNPGEEDRQRRFIERNQYPADILRPVNRQEAEALTGGKLESGGLWFPASGWLEPGKLCKALAMHPRINKLLGCSITQMTASADGWHLLGPDSLTPNLYADRVVICAGHLSPQIIPGTGGFRFKAIRGQVTYLPDAIANSPKAVVCGARYLNPAHGDQDQKMAVIGATFDLHNTDPSTTVESHRENIQALSAMVPQMLSADLATGTLPEQLEGRVGFRCTTHDYQPVAGQFYNSEGREVTGLYLLTGLGSKGLTYAPLLAEFVADQITGQPAALPALLAKRLASGRMHQPK
ncbi:bifunctional tRNA (5-methylaminomethyl-2-thiouridine)(34)-methyltransferase MnmD/FAD-dependent 5-carboxymethylaminomethyl-2-thiouridine(34) oxidoreductase MnmC [Marinobacter salexigens]|uniref:bifunctional tRNA (5-methylaminomethyl-2-thiouridine)(34)-methyltransferase MnmD/FAD-dependent 5-carboxymethylaminomethyl-2-thiouridine(34) oxidoreductase MnmC n=1 Tax=Marinobacter salexigens TaxID=1925763 RepID=UPI000C2905E7|nr:bifunctional tRNA (5-methylaminomethyl-2-thiouridine)(34)-methyltransferase MnmD/FAD-dependent 5-carboxymethylaminomethyl-2-thiouridine(34) oxidoreductase MnmC [Marinobacter salexigens]